jgi:hypothetical protein
MTSINSELSLTAPALDAPRLAGWRAAAGGQERARPSGIGGESSPSFPRKKAGDTNPTHRKPGSARLGLGQEQK